MKLACIWHSAAERSMIERAVQLEESSWKVISFRYTEAATLEKLLLILKGGYDAILLHLSTPQCGALKLAELYHRDHLATRIILTSRTDADPGALSSLFCGLIHPDDEIFGAVVKIRTIIKTPPNYLGRKDLENAIVSVFNTDQVLSHQFRDRFEELYRGPFTFDDYRRFAHACLVEDASASETSIRGGVFVSYAAEDQSLADEMRQSLVKRGIKVFLASRDIAAGAVWDSDIRDAIVASSEMLVIITPNSRDKAWVMIEAGAGWALGKHLTPCVAFVDVNELPAAISRFETRSIVTRKERDRLIREICVRVGAPENGPTASVVEGNARKTPKKMRR